MDAPPQREAGEPGILTFPCKACGADLAFAPGAEALRCPYCDHSEKIARSADEIVEHAFESYASLGKKTGWGTALKEIRCESCGASFQVEPQVTSATCPFCGSAAVQERPSGETERLQPESVIPFAISSDQVRTSFEAWLKRLWFRPNALKRFAVTEKRLIKGMYIPFWTFDALTQSFWTAESGYYYYETESYWEQDANGERVERTRQVRKVRWEYSSGRHSAFFDDVLVPASRGVDPALASRLRYQTGALVPYQPQYLVGLGAEDYRIDMPEAWPVAQREIDGAIYRACGQMVPGDTHRNLQVRTSYHNRSFKLCLLPIWVASYRYQGKPYRFLCNGQTGEIEGEAPWSWIKITLFAAAMAALIVGLLFLLGVF